MAEYRIVCTDQVPWNLPTSHAHIVAVGVGPDPAAADAKHTKEEVIAAIGAGHRYYTVSPSTQRRAYVEVVQCGYRCGQPIIRSIPDQVVDNNLDNLRRCSWKN